LLSFSKSSSLDRSFDPKTHGGVVSLFSQHLIDGKNITKDDAKFLSTSQTRREKTEYDYETVNQELNQLFEQTEEFIGKMKKAANY
jgi:uncharacterized protein (UPF0332 family)